MLSNACDRAAYAVAKPTCTRRKEFEKRICLIFQLDQDMFCCCTVVVVVVDVVCVFCFSYFSFVAEKNEQQKSSLVSSLFTFVRRLLFIL